MFNNLSCVLIQATQGDRTEWKAPQQAEFSHGKLQWTRTAHNWLPPNYYE